MLDISIRSGPGDIRDQILKLSKMAANFAPFGPYFYLWEPVPNFGTYYKTELTSDHAQQSFAAIDLRSSEISRKKERKKEREKGRKKHQQ